MKDIINSLNSKQKEGVLTTEGAVLLLAGAGSGKTRVLTIRIAYLIAQGVRPFNILAITFTNKASKEMRERVDGITQYGKDVWISTFHSACVRILRREIHHLGYTNQFTIYDTEDCDKVLKEIYKLFKIDDKRNPLKAVSAQISSQKNEFVDDKKFEELYQGQFQFRDTIEIYKKYQETLQNNNALDFDDLIFKTIELFIKFPEILEKYQDRFQYIMVDEYQDTNTAQYTLVKLLAGKYKNLCVVGDDDQSIYGWRGANIRNILDFEKDFENVAVIKLEQNYRSTKAILNCANEVIKNNYGRKDKALWTENPEGELIKFNNCNSDREEVQFVVDKIKDGIKNGRKYKDFAVLYRANALSRIMEEKLVIESIPYRLYGGVNFYGRKEIKDILSYLRFLNNPKDDISLKRIINVPKRGIGDTTVLKLSEIAYENNISIFELISTVDKSTLGIRGNKLDDFKEVILKINESINGVTVSEIIREVLEKTNYKQELINEGTEEALGRIENLDEFINKAIEFEEFSEDLTLSSFLEDVALVAEVDNKDEDSDNKVSLMTLHSSKGLEFKEVFVIGFEDGLFPGNRAITSPDENDMEEERRLCYVGITRAEEKLYLTSAKSRLQNGNFVNNMPSRFLKELPKDYVEILSPIKSTVKIVNNINATSSFKPNPAYKSGGLSAFKIDKPKNVIIDFEVNDTVKHIRFGEGIVKQIVPAGADYEVTVEFENTCIKKLMANLSKLKKV